MNQFAVPSIMARAQFLQQRRAYGQAAELFTHVTAVEPCNAAAWAGAGMCLMAQKETGPALRYLRRAVALDASQALAHNSIGYEMLRRKAPAAALRSFEAAIAADPGWQMPVLNAAVAEQNLGRAAQAVLRIRDFLNQYPETAAARFALGVAHHLSGDPAAAAEAYRQALQLQPDHVEATFNLGRAQRDLGDIEAGIAWYRKAIALRPEYTQAHWNLSLALLLAGHLREGWEEYEWRWKLDGFPSTRRNFPQPLWNGEPIAGRRILLHAEQGFGDSLQFMRYAPLVAAQGAEVILEIQPQLRRLAAGLPGVATLLNKGDAIPPFDIHAPLLSLPRAFGTGLDNIPCTVPYLHPDPALVEKWRHWLPATGAPRVALVWAGRPTHSNDARRSTGLEALRPLLDLPGLDFVSLQVGPRSEDIARLGLADRIEDLSGRLMDFAETAAALSHIDLLISVDTSVVHLAGALDRQVRVILPFAPDWRWLQGRDDTPWYPTVRLLRQQQPGDWSVPAAMLADELRALPSRPPRHAAGQPDA